MAPKKTQSKAQGEKRKHEEVEKQPNEAELDASPESMIKESKEEYEASEPEPPTKTAKKESSSPLEWLLSDEAFDLANPEIPEGHGEIDWDPSKPKERPAKQPPSEDAGKKGVKAKTAEGEEGEGNGNGKGAGEGILRYPQSRLTPFQNLVSASILSKPLSHKLGLRTIQTLLNPPFSLRTWKDLDEAGYEGRRKVMWEARTQHKERTASLLGDLCDGVKELCGEDEEDLSELSGLKEQLKGSKSPKEAQEKVVNILTEIKGIGPGVASIFLRRVQADWEEVFPYVDDRSLSAARSFGLLEEGQGAKELAAQVGRDRGKYVKLVDTLVGIELEKKVDEAIQLAGV